MKSFILFTLLTFIISGCDSKQPSEKNIVSSELINSVWKQETAVGEPPVCYIELKKDGKLGYNEEEAHNFDYDDADSWSVINNTLTIIWTDGYTIDEFPLKKEKAMKLIGTQNIIKDKDMKGKSEAIMYRLR